jgi:hypothetical protein
MSTSSATPRSPIPDRKSANRLEALEEVAAYIEAIDFEPLKAKLIAPSDDGGHDWSLGRADYFERLYRNWLYLRRKHEGELMPPHRGVDEFWHAHILDTFAYFRDTDAIFGYYFHHFPYFGTRGPDDEANLANAWENTQRRYFEEYGDYIYDWEEDASG